MKKGVYVGRNCQRLRPVTDYRVRSTTRERAPHVELKCGDYRITMTPERANEVGKRLIREAARSAEVTAAVQEIDVKYAVDRSLGTALAVFEEKAEEATLGTDASTLN